MKQSLVSIIVPVYNIERYLDRCVESIVNQTYRNIEVILVDDGSTDKTSQICDAWAKKDDRVRVIHKENEGQGIARNKGIEIANGQYFCFFDGDDYVREDTIHVAYSKLTETGADIACFGFTIVNYDNELVKKIVPATSQDFYGGENVRNIFLPMLVGPNLHTGKQYDLCMSACAIMVKRALIDEIEWRFVSEREYLSEDSYSLLKLFSYAQGVCVVPEPLYYYYENPTSFSRRYCSDRFEKINNYYVQTMQLCDDLNCVSEVSYRVAWNYLNFVIMELKQAVLLNCATTERIWNIKQIINDNILQDVLKEHKTDKVNLKKKILFWAMRNKLKYITFAIVKMRNCLNT